MPKPINISASRGASILGLSKWKTPVESWLEVMESREPGFCEKNNYELPVFEYNSAMRWGHAFESAIIELAEDRRDCRIFDREVLYKNGLFMTCHIDGKYADTIQALHEGKTTTAFYFRDNFGEPGTDKVPIEYQIQCQHQMICTGAEKVILSVLVFPHRVEEWEEMGWMPEQDEHLWIIDNEILQKTATPGRWAKTLNEMGYFHQYEITAHKELQDLMIKHYTDFWNEHVLAGKAPEPKTYGDIKRLVREPVGTIIADENIERLMSEYKHIKSEIGQGGTLSKRIDQIKIEVMQYMTDQTGVIDDDSQDKFILRNQAGKKIASYGKNKNGSYIFR